MPNNWKTELQKNGINQDTLLYKFCSGLVSKYDSDNDQAVKNTIKIRDAIKAVVLNEMSADDSKSLINSFLDLT